MNSNMSPTDVSESHADMSLVLILVLVSHAVIVEVFSHSFSLLDFLLFLSFH